jgi:predicted nucleic acid-binding Zn ribbon protein
MGSASDEANCPRCGAAAKKMLSLVAAVNRGESQSEAGSQYRAGSGGGCACGGHCGCGGHH